MLIDIRATLASVVDKPDRAVRFDRDVLEDYHDKVHLAVVVLAARVQLDKRVQDQHVDPTFLQYLNELISLRRANQFAARLADCQQQSIDGPIAKPEKVVNLRRLYTMKVHDCHDPTHRL